jgi:hypothetical protein
VKSLESLVAEKQAVTSKEKELIDGLNAVLGKMGYRVVASATVPKRRGRPPRATARRPAARRAPAVAGAAVVGPGVLRRPKTPRSGEVGRRR